jgi:acyl-CoA thioester hydrolase
MMGVMHYENYQARYDECDAFGFLRHCNYLRWMQETAFAASAAVGYDFARYDEIGGLWLVRETDIEYLSPIRYGDEVEVKTWVVDFQRIRSRRAYELRNTESGQLAARAWTDWIYLDSETLHPALIPADMQDVFLPEGTPDASAGRNRFPKVMAPSEGFFSHRTRVEWGDIDLMWHVNNADYLRYIENADVQLDCTNGGVTSQTVESGIKVETRRHRIEYRQPARLGDELEIVTWCSAVEDEVIHQCYHIRRVDDGALLTQALALRVFSDGPDRANTNTTSGE